MSATSPQRVDNTRARTAVGALRANGWTVRALADQLGVPEQLLRGVLEPGRKILVEAEGHILDLAENICDRHGGDDAEARAARAEGYWPPIHYDDRWRFLPKSIRRPQPHQGDSAEYLAAETLAAVWDIRYRGRTIASICANRGHHYRDDPLTRRISRLLARLDITANPDGGSPGRLLGSPEKLRILDRELAAWQSGDDATEVCKRIRSHKPDPRAAAKAAAGVQVGDVAA